MQLIQTTYRLKNIILTLHSIEFLCKNTQIKNSFQKEELSLFGKTVYVLKIINTLLTLYFIFDTTILMNIYFNAKFSKIFVYNKPKKGCKMRQKIIIVILIILIPLCISAQYFKYTSNPTFTKDYKRRS